MEKYLREMTNEEKAECVSLLLDGNLLYKGSCGWDRATVLSEDFVYKSGKENHSHFKEQVVYKPIVHGKFILMPYPLPLKPSYEDDDWTTCDACFMNKHHMLITSKESECPVDDDGNLYCESCRVEVDSQSVTQVVYRETLSSLTKNAGGAQ